METSRMIAMARKRSGLTIRQLAVRARTSHSAIAAYESGAKAPNTATLRRIVEACGFATRTELVPVSPFEDRSARGEELVEVLELAEVFPSERGGAISGLFRPA